MLLNLLRQVNTSSKSIAAPDSKCALGHNLPFKSVRIMVLTPIFERQFSDNSFGFRQRRGAHDALKQSKRNADDGYVYVVDMDLEKFFDKVCQSKLIDQA